MKIKYIIFITLMPIFYIVWQFILTSYFLFTVLPGNEAIVTQFGDIVGEPRKTGLHRKNPLTQKVHQIRMAELRKWSNEMDIEREYILRVYWNVGNSLLFYNNSQKKNVDNELGIIFTSTHSYLESNVEKTIIQNIAEMKKEDWDYMDNNLQSLIKMTQKEVDKYGVNLVRIDILNQ